MLAVERSSAWHSLEEVSTSHFQLPGRRPSSVLSLSAQTINDWYDREIDAINEPYRPIPSGAISEVSTPFVALACLVRYFFWSTEQAQ